ncbi:hypothetical protein ACWD4V_19210 [Streptomyces tsukubensis]
MRSIRPLLAGVGLVGALTLTTACGLSENRSSGEPETVSSPAAGPGTAAPPSTAAVPSPTAEQPATAAPSPSPARSGDSHRSGTADPKWRAGGWKDWDRGTWRRDSDDFVNPVIDDLWKPDRMVTAEPPDRTVEPDTDPVVEDGSDPEPAAVEARPERTPYRQHAATSGKVFFDAPEGTMVCSATVVKDPANPGRSNLVWTAGHCVHAGAKGGWYRNIAFVPAYNSGGLPARELAAAAPEDVAPYGTFWADWVATSDRWIATGDPADGTGAPYDYAVLHVKPEDGTASLEETVGSALDVDFAAPEAHRVTSLGIRGYPAAAPYDGALMHSCTDRPGRFAFDTAAPVMWRMGCTMTGGSSGGGWVTDRAGTPVLVSNTSIGPADPVWLAGPRLGKDAERVYTSVSAKYAAQP